jgi:hypothetical protein
MCEDRSYSEEGAEGGCSCEIEMDLQGKGAEEAVRQAERSEIEPDGYSKSSEVP